MPRAQRWVRIAALVVCAVTSISAAHPASDDAARVHYDAGLAAKQARKYDVALRELRQAIAADADNAGAHWALAWVHIARDEPAHAVGEFGEVVRLAPGTLEARESQAAIARVLARCGSPAPQLVPAQGQGPAGEAASAARARASSPEPRQASETITAGQPRQVTSAAAAASPAERPATDAPSATRTPDAKSRALSPTTHRSPSQLPACIHPWTYARLKRLGAMDAEIDGDGDDQSAGTHDPVGAIGGHAFGHCIDLPSRFMLREWFDRAVDAGFVVFVRNEPYWHEPHIHAIDVAPLAAGDGSIPRRRDLVDSQVSDWLRGRNGLRDGGVIPGHWMPTPAQIERIRGIASGRVPVVVDR